MAEHEHVWEYLSSMGDPYRRCQECGHTEDVDDTPAYDAVRAQLGTEPTRTHVQTLDELLKQ